MFRFIRKIISSIIDFILYRVLSEKQKTFLANLFSEKQKNIIKKVTKFGKRNNQQKLLKQINTHLYSLGFTDRALTELINMLETYENDSFMKKLISWELALWYANQYTVEGAEKSLKYLQIAEEEERDQDQLRRIAILKAECFERLQKTEAGKQVIEASLQRKEHPDLFLAMANLKQTIDQRLNWMNKAMDAYGLQHITFCPDTDQTTYDDLQTLPNERSVTSGPKVSVLLPAYNAEQGIQIAIESILSQTWENIELLIVDDCSPDKTKDVIKQYMEKDKRIKLFSTPENSGPYVARNIGLQHVTGDFITVNDADDWSHAEKIEIQVNHLIQNPTVVANTSEHARLTEDLKLYRRGTPGRYIFSNMSSLMFRREPVAEKLGYWDSVRFAADGEFKRRLTKQFGEQSVIDLQTGPLSLPRQSVSSLTSSSAFGYDGFFMGARKEYVESLENYHQQTESLYYPYPQIDRPYPVPEPMWPRREEKQAGMRQFDVVIATDFRLIDDLLVKEISELKQSTDRIALVQLNKYDLTLETDLQTNVRQLIDGKHIQMIVYGEKIATETLLVIDHLVLLDLQRYVPHIQPEKTHVLMTTQSTSEHINVATNHLHHYFGQVGTWYALNAEANESLDQSEVAVANKGWGSLHHYV